VLLALVTSCGASSSSPGSTQSSPKVGCLETSSTTHTCTCGVEIGSLSSSSEQISTCSAATVGGVAACCALLDAGKDCSCQAYVCSYLSANSTSGACTCYWGNDPLRAPP
jgi:hypothetical protein